MLELGAGLSLNGMTAEVLLDCSCHSSVVGSNDFINMKDLDTTKTTCRRITLSHSSQALGARSVTVTDGDAAVLELAKANYGFNFPGQTNWRMEVLRFGDDADAAAVAANRRIDARSPASKTTFDVIVGSDLTYKRGGWPAFVGSVKTFSAPGETTVMSPLVSPALKNDQRSSSLSSQVLFDNTPLFSLSVPGAVRDDCPISQRVQRLNRAI